jgi:CheY-like chemotaxis protein/HPt (histidine-containing phosphotransfer) domain-containing protein
MVMLTSGGQRGDVTRLRKVGFAGYLIKPVKKAHLYECLATVLGLVESLPASAPGPVITRHLLSEEKKRRIRILIAEDNVVNQKVAVRMLEKLGYRADAVADGREAVRALKRIPYDLVLMDVQMPQMDGFEATRIIRDPDSCILHPHVPIVAMTAHALKGDRQKCLEAGMDDYISKPVALPALQRVIDRYLEARSIPTDPARDSRAPGTQAEHIARIQEIAYGDLEFEREIIEIFLTSSEEHLVRLERAVRESDLQGARREAHALKGSSANAGAKNMQQLASVLEEMAAEGKPSGTDDLLRRLWREFEAVRASFLAYVRSPRFASARAAGPGDGLQGRTPAVNPEDPHLA